MSELILTKIEDYVLTVQLNRPEKKNAVNLDMCAAMADALEKAEKDKSVFDFLL